MEHSIIEILNDLRPEFDFSAGEDFIESGMLDSFDIITLVNTLDERFNISIDGIDIVPENFSSIERIINLLKKKGISEINH